MQNKFYELAEKVVNYAISRGVSHQTTGYQPYNKKRIVIGDKEFVNFSLCDYLGLATDDRIITAAVEAVKRNGVYTAISRTYLRLNIYEEAEEMLSDPSFNTFTNIRITGVMGMATYTEDEEVIKSEFARLKQYFDQLKDNFFANDLSFREISMGMTGDYKLAIEEGSTMIRIGTALFGARSYGQFHP